MTWQAASPACGSRTATGPSPPARRSQRFSHGRARAELQPNPRRLGRPARAGAGWSTPSPMVGKRKRRRTRRMSTMRYASLGGGWSRFIRARHAHTRPSAGRGGGGDGQAQELQGRCRKEGPRLEFHYCVKFHQNQEQKSRFVTTCTLFRGRGGRTRGGAFTHVRGCHDGLGRQSLQAD